MLTGKFGDYGADGGGSCEIDFAGCWMGNESLDDSRGIFAAVLNDVQYARRESRVFENLTDKVMGAGA
jgi:hypothetical protein